MRTPQRGVKEKCMEIINISCSTLLLYNSNVPTDSHLETSKADPSDSHALLHACLDSMEDNS